MATPISSRMADILRALFRSGRAMTGNDLGRACGFTTGHNARRPQCNHAGRVMGPAQHVIFSLIALRKRGLVSMVSRRDGLSGTAYVLTESGRLVAGSLNAE